MKNRHLARQAALQTLVSLLLHPEKAEDIIAFVHKEFAPQLTNITFTTNIVLGVLEHQSQIDEIIQKFAPEWPIQKLDPVERTVLEMGTYELYHTDTPPAVIINEAVDLAKEFGDDTAGRFINGVLSSISKTISKPS
jgi:N utilization substance protein B